VLRQLSLICVYWIRPVAEAHRAQVRGLVSFSVSRQCSQTWMDGGGSKKNSRPSSSGRAQFETNLCSDFGIISTNYEQSKPQLLKTRPTRTTTTFSTTTTTIHDCNWCTKKLQQYLLLDRLRRSFRYFIERPLQRWTSAQALIPDQK
jgi:hypothetical protein